LATQGLGRRLDNVELSLIGVAANTNEGVIAVTPMIQPHHHSGLDETVNSLSRTMNYGPRETVDMTDETVKELVARVETRINLMEKKFHGLIARSDERAVTFAGLGFQSTTDSNAWFETELRRRQSGLMVDIHMVFEHIFHAINGIDTIAMVEMLYKIKVTCIADSVAMTSFDAKTSKHFQGSMGIRS
jgi:hypothetical protein